MPSIQMSAFVRPTVAAANCAVDAVTMETVTCVVPASVERYSAYHPFNQIFRGADKGPCEDIVTEMHQQKLMSL